MAPTRLWRPLTALAAVAIGLVSALSGGSPLAAAFAALMFGIVAGSVIWAPAEAGPRAGAADDEPAPPPLPGAGDVIDAIEDPMLLVRDRRVVHANAAARAVLGQHIDGVDVRLAIRHPAAAEQLISRGGDQTAERLTRIELVGLGERDRRWAMTILRLGDGSRLVRLSDRSEAFASEQMRVDFVANASHELRTPLATLIGFAETLQDDATAEDRKTRHRFLTIMSDEARRMQQLIDDLISLSRIEAERFSPPREAVPLLPLVEEVRVGCAQLIAEKGSGIRVEQGVADPVVPGDRAQLLQMLRNLVINALKYGRQGEDVVIRFDPAGPEMVRMRVIDRGEGIAQEHLPRLTERFYRVDPSRSRAMGGTGLGLAIVKHIAQRHRGRLDIASRPGEGTAVSVYLPALSSKSHRTVTEVSRKANRDDPDAP
ncbi:MAG TPA: ATP-binding protein [Allosphingosinicella sp.]|jgi:two-component system phosphate regulon sensor histidine kinase PhoR